MPKLKLPLFILIGFVIASCSTKKSTPESVALSFYDVLYNDHDLEKAAELVTEASKEKLRNDFNFIEGALQIIEESTPTVYTYEVIPTKTIIKNDSAFIFVRSSLDTSAMQTLLLNVNGEWLIDFNYNVPVDAFSKEIINNVLEVMDKYADKAIIEN